MARKSKTTKCAYIAMTRSWPGGWAKAPTPDKAVDVLRSEWGLAHMKRYGFTVHRVDPKTTVSEMAALCYPKGSPPELIRCVDGKIDEGKSRTGFKQAAKPAKPTHQAGIMDVNSDVAH
jgi:hypothetical protein